MAITAEQIARARPFSHYKKGLVVHVHDKMQTDYTYTLSENPGKNMAVEFELTPVQALVLGIVDGKYFRDTYTEFPREWFQRGKFSELAGRDASVNYFAVSSRQSLQEWQRKHWIPCAAGDPDVRGFLQWAARYWLGRRDDRVDTVQLARYRAIVRHRGAITKGCTHTKKDFYVKQLRKTFHCCSQLTTCRAKQRQTLLNWLRVPFV